MRKDFNSYQGNTTGKKSPEEDVLSSFAKKYEGKTEEEMIAEILQVAGENRKNGTLSDADIDRYVAILSPMLDDKKRKKLLAITEKLKKNK